MQSNLSQANLSQANLSRATRMGLLAWILWGVWGCNDPAGGGRADDDPDGAVAMDAAVTRDGEGSDQFFPDVGQPDSDAMNADAESPEAGPVDAAPVDMAPEPEPDRTDEVYARDRLLEVRIEIDPDDYEVLRQQRRTSLDILGPECRLPPSPFTWFSARVTVDGEVFENVGVRKKGFFGSVSASRPSFKVRFDKFVDDQTFLGVKRLTLNNARQDASKVRQCLAYDLFRAAGTPASRCNFAQVFVNGQDLGAYVNVESIKKPFLRRHFADDEGNLYEGTLSDFREGWTGTIEQKTNGDVPDTRAIDAIAAALAAPDDRLLEELSVPLDLDAFITFWATEILVAHWDGYSGNTNNHYFYEDPTTGKVQFIPWGTDGSFIPPIMYFERRLAPRSINAAGLIARRLYRHPVGQQMYLERLLSLVDLLWDVDALRASIDEMEEVFGSAVLGRNQAAATAGLRETIDFVGTHGDLIRQEIASGPVPWNVPLRGGRCQQRAGTAEGSFQTTWGSWPTGDTFATGTGMISVEINGQVLAIRAVGAAFGPNEEDRSRAQMIIPLLLPNDAINFFSLNVPVDGIRDGAEFDVSDPVNDCALSSYNPATRRVGPIASCQAGSFILDTASTTQGAPIRGRFDVGLWARGR